MALQPITATIKRGIRIMGGTLAGILIYIIVILCILIKVKEEGYL